MKRIYGARVNGALICDFLRSAGDMRRARKNGDIDERFIKRIMLAVTQVNGCALCSWFHTKEALRLGIPQNEISRLLKGDMDGVPEEQAAALVYARHYADTLGRVDAGAWRYIVNLYGVRKALGIRAAVRMIMAGNAQGNIWGAFASRLKGWPEAGSSLAKELSVFALDIFGVPFMLVWAAYSALIRRIIPACAVSDEIS